MVRDLFETLLEETGQILGIADLHPDQNNSCLIGLKSGVRIQMELDKRGDFLILCCSLGSPPGGKYRENLFRQALKANELLPDQVGIFAYSVKTDHMLLFQKLPLNDLNGQKIAAAITPLSEKAAAWIEAIAHNDVPPLEQTYASSQQGGGMFGLK